MRGLVVLATILTVVALVCTQALAEPLVSQDWEAGAGAWVDNGGSPAATIVSDAVTGSGNNALLTPGTIIGAPGAKQITLDAETGKNWGASWDFYTAGATREFLTLYSYTGLAIGSGLLQQAVSLGVYDSTDVTKYNFRIAQGATELSGGGWGDTIVARTNNVWHSMRVEQVWNSGDSFATLNFFVDGLLGATWTTAAVHGVTAIRMGSALSNGGVGAYYDNFSLTEVPEPGSIFAVGGGLMALMGFARRRRV